MAASVPALVNPSLLTWAREQSGYSPSTIAAEVARSSAVAKKVRAVLLCYALTNNILQGHRLARA